MKSTPRIVAIFLGIVLIVGSGIGYWKWYSKPPVLNVADNSNLSVPENPQISFVTPFRNVRPGVKYLGDQACFTCHSEIHKSFHQHSMGRSAILVSDPNLNDHYDSKTQPHFTSPKGREYQVEKVNDKVIHTEIFKSSDGKTIIPTRVEASIAIGSGHLGKSYLSVRDGSLWQTGVSWFTSKQQWDLSPGFNPGRHGTRPIMPGCMICHVNQFEHITGTVNRFKEPILGNQTSIGCERCHGPGELHVNEQTTTKSTVIPDTSIVNPKHLEPALRDAICQQCHMLGERRIVRRGRELNEFRPGLPLELFEAIYVKENSLSQKSVSQVEQIRSSKCSIASEGKLSCSSCHNPHEKPAEAKKEFHFRQACLKCHTDQSCKTPIADRQAKNDSCVACHMSTGGSSNIPHAAVTDHRILRKPDLSSKNTAKSSDLPFVHFHAKSKYLSDADESERDLGVALAKHIDERDQNNHSLIAESIKRLQAAVQKHPNDATSWEMLARLRSYRDEWKEALENVEKALAITPNDEAALVLAAECAHFTEQNQKSLDYARRALALNPGNFDNHWYVGNALLELGEFKNAAAEFQKVIDVVPSRANAYASLAVCKYKMGDLKGGRKMLDLAIELEPERAKQYREMYQRKTR